MISVPEDAEAFLRSGDAFDDLHNAAAYALELSKPADLEAQWDDRYSEYPRPDYFDELVAAESVVYVGGTSDLLSRLEDHSEKNHRVSILTELCEIERIRTVWWVDSGDPMLEEVQLADMLTAELPPTTYVHQR